MKVKEVADLVGVSVRTLHHYDEIGLLAPEKTTAAGYRVYTEVQLATLQQILFLKELDFPLKKIKEVLNSPTYKRQAALAQQYQWLLKKRERLDRIIETMEKTIADEKGEIVMTQEEKFAGFTFDKHPYAAEAREKWGAKAVETAEQKVAEMDSKEQAAFNDIYRKLANLRHMAPEEEIVQAEIANWYRYVNQFSNYSFAAFKGLGELYVADQRFTKNIDQFGEGLAVFMRDAMAIYADKQ